MLIQGESVSLRALERSDLVLLHQWENDEDLMRWVRNSPDFMVSLEAIEKEFEREVSGVLLENRRFAIVLNSTGKMIGIASLKWFRQWATKASVGLFIADKELRNKGLGTEAAYLLGEVAFMQLNLHRVEIATVEENEPVITAAIHNGFKQEGRLVDAVFFDGRYHDTLLFGLLQDDYKRIIKERNGEKKTHAKAPSISPPAQK